MADILFLTLGDVLEIHQDQIDHYGGDPGIRDMGLLASAVAQPQATFDGAYLHGDVVTMAAAYLFHLVQNHPFVDGNKRVGAASADVFLAINGIDLPAACEDDLVELVMATAQGATTTAAIATAFHRWLAPPADRT